MSRLTIDLDDWTRAGSDLLRVDPKRFLRVLEIVENIVRAHDDPRSVSIREAYPDGGETEPPS